MRIMFIQSMMQIQSTPDNLNLQGKWKKVQLIGSSNKMARSKKKNHCLLYSVHFNHINL